MSSFFDLSCNVGGFGDNPNHHFVKDKAYTEDDVLVYNVFVHNIPIKTTNSEFSEYFKRFGDIVSVYLYRDHIKKASQKLGFVNYKDALSAAKALRHSIHSMNEKRIWVRACHSWHQPDAKPSVTTATTDAEVVATNNASVLNLNDDCLDVIFKHLKMVDQINLAQCCRRLQDVFVMRAKVDYKILDFYKLTSLKLCQIRQFFQMAGPQIEKFTLTNGKYFKSVVKFLGIYCLNVKSVIITVVQLTASEFRNLLKNMHMVEELKLNCAHLKDNSILVLRKFKNLKILSLENGFNLTGKHIEGLTTLESLSLNGCRRILSPLFSKICKYLTDLKYLDVQGCSQLDLSVIQDIVKYMHKLDTIKLACGNCRIDCIASLPSLKHLHLYYDMNTETPEIFVELVKHQADQLETLALHNYNRINHETTIYIGQLRKLKELTCPNNYEFDDNCLSNISQLQELELLNIAHCERFSAKGLLDFIQKCPKLTTLNVSYCKQLKEEFATKVLQLLIAEKKHRDQKKPLEIIAFRSGIPYFAINTTAFKSATDLLSISNAVNDFDYDDDYDGVYDDDDDYDDYYRCSPEDSDYEYDIDLDEDYWRRVREDY